MLVLEMTFVLWRSYSNTRKSIFSCRKCNAITSLNEIVSRSFSDEKDNDDQEFINSTIMIENGYNVSELPVVIRKLKNLTELESYEKGTVNNVSDSSSYPLIQDEFNQCMDLRDVFSLINKCTKITPNIALGAIERIYDLEKNPLSLPFDTKNDQNIIFAKGAILDKLLKVVMKTEDTQTILNILKTNSSLIEPYKPKFCDELLLRVTDSKLSIDHLSQFASFLMKNSNEHYTEILDKLWVGFIANEKHINESNIVQIFNILSGLKVSKKMIINLAEQKLSELWPRIDSLSMQDIMGVFIVEKYFSMQSFAVLGNWFYANIHCLDEDTMLDIITKLTRLNYTDDQIEAAVEKYTKLKGPKVTSYILIIGILNYCMQFQLRNEQILDVCCDHYIKKIDSIPHSFLKSFIYPFGHLYYQPPIKNFWNLSEIKLLETYQKISVDDLCSIILSYIYIGKYPLQLVSKVFHPEYVTRINSPHLLQKLYLIDTSLSIECEDYSGPLMPKDQWLQPVVQDVRISNIVSKIKDTIVAIVGENRISTEVLVPNYCSDESFLIDILLHPVGLGSDTFNWKLKITKTENLAILIHLPDHYCSKSDQLIGSQMMKIRHLKVLGFNVVSLKYSVLSQLYMSHKTSDLRKYLEDNIIGKQT
ncbi:FAST kinase domain-containing protein 3, mitochondrial-like [Zerene cesonia]|uniref:FAST kinase domain-containing protein 3, mitochondrial-like n=1 Tax=Zerene cesonia TaxID=33412 RepID=UPI0018E55F41|nr:FAST kinase domain-containing protein 3, mitochondrial-like [Zerene cesonia]